MFKSKKLFTKKRKTKSKKKAKFRLYKTSLLNILLKLKNNVIV